MIAVMRHNSVMWTLTKERHESMLAGAKRETQSWLTIDMRLLQARRTAPIYGYAVFTHVKFNTKP